MTSLCIVNQLEGSSAFFLSAPSSTIGRQITYLGIQKGIIPICVASQDEIGKISSTVIVENDQKSKISEFSNLYNILRAVDLVGGETTSLLIDSLQKGGKLISAGSLSMKPVTFDPRQFIFQRKEIVGFNLYHHLPLNNRENLNKLIDENLDIFKPKIASVFSLSNYLQALKYYFTNFHEGKVLLKLS